jgi:hypothetical protein
MRAAAREIEARVVPWTMNGAAEYTAFSQRPAVMRAGRAERVDAAGVAHEHDRLAVDVTEERRTVVELALGDALF